MKKISTIILMTLISASLFAQKKVIINGEVSGDTNGKLIVHMYTRMASDSAEVKNGKFKFEFPFATAEPKFFYLKDPTKQGSMYTPYAILIDGPGTVNVKIDAAKGFNGATLTGMESAVSLDKFNTESVRVRKIVGEAMKAKYGAAWLPESDPKSAAFQEDNKKLFTENIIPFLNNQFKKHPNSYASAYIFANVASQLPLEEQKKLFNMLSPKMKQTEEAKTIMAKIEGISNSAIGNTVANFILPDPQDKDFDFSSLKGKYVMIDFWASWCAPCRQSFPRIRQVYDFFKNDNFEIYSISIDKNKAAWLKAVEEENNPWPQTLDNQMIAYSGFNVSAVPTAYLISPEGKIIMKEIGFDPKGGGEIERKLEELFGKKVPAPMNAKKEVKKEEVKGAVQKAAPMMRMN